jgi:hypothetical protein
MEEQFILKEYGDLSLFEQNQMVAEDRAWWIKRLEREYEEKAKREQDAMGSGGSRPSVPGMPSIPSVNLPNIPRPSMPGR